MFESNSNNHATAAYGTDPDTTAAAMQVVIESVDWGAVQDRNKYLGSVEVPWGVFHGTKGHPNQRVTAQHAARLVLSGVLEKPLDIHRCVSAVMVGNVAESERLFKAAKAGVFDLEGTFKLDGHSRTLAQANGRAPVPETVIVHVYAAVDAAASAALYNAFDSGVSTKKNADKGQSALRSAGLEPQSALFQNGSVILKALRLGSAIIDEGTVHTKTVNAAKSAESGEMTLDQALAALIPGLELAKRFLPQLKVLDEIGIVGKTMPANSDAVGAYLAIMVSDPDGAREFLTALRAGKALLEDGTADALYMASQAIKTASDKRRRLKGIDRTQSIVATIINAFNGHKAGETFDASKPLSAPGCIPALFAAQRKAAAA